jgi:hypothetical protein
VEVFCEARRFEHGALRLVLSDHSRWTISGANLPSPGTGACLPRALARESVNVLALALGFGRPIGGWQCVRFPQDKAHVPCPQCDGLLRVGRKPASTRVRGSRGNWRVLVGVCDGDPGHYEAWAIPVRHHVRQSHNRLSGRSQG